MKPPYTITPKIINYITSMSEKIGVEIKLFSKVGEKTKRSIS